ncbi:MAG: ATP-binding cassette domain-containing protein [Saprospiraceae bacterium]
MVSLQHITKVFNKGEINEVRALDDIHLTINEGEFLIIIGANGSGKSTLLNIIQGAEKPTEGNIKINNVDITEIAEYQRSKWVARVFQNPNNGTAPDLTILENFRLAALRSQQKSLTIGLSTSFKKRVQENIAALEMGLENKINQLMGSLSGGQRQALTLLMSMMDHSEIILMDEPTAALDPKSSQLVLNLADKINRINGKTLILITHHLKDALQYGNRLIQMKAGSIALDLNTQEKRQLTLPKILDLFT